MSAQNRLVTLAKQLLSPSTCEHCSSCTAETQVRALLLTCSQGAGAHTHCHAHLLSQQASSQPYPVLVIAPEVQAALKQGRAVVALESTIISHGAIMDPAQ